MMWCTTQLNIVVDKRNKCVLRLNNLKIEGTSIQLCRVISGLQGIILNYRLQS